MIVSLALIGCRPSAASRFNNNGINSVESAANPAQNFDQGLQAYAQGNYADAAHLFRLVLAADPDNINAEKWLAETERRLNTPTPRPTSSPPATPTPRNFAPPPQIVDSYGIEMLLVPAGEFIMGSDQGFPDEVPVHTVYLVSFYIDLTETTNKSYEQCVDDGGCQPPRRLDCCTEQPGNYVAFPSYFKNPEFDDYPVIFITWYDARDYCEWRGARLLTEAEWEKAARGSGGQPYPWGSDQPAPQYLNFFWLPGEFSGRPLSTAAPVNSFPDGASPYGVINMVGNVYEWVWDIYDPNYYAYSPYENPMGPAEGAFRVTRGGSFFNQAFRNRAANRNNAFIPADSFHFDGGVRCGKDVPAN